MTIKTLTLDYSYQRLVQMMLATILLLAGLYVYFVIAIVWDAADRETILSQSSELASAVSTLETQYVNLSGKVTLGSARILGFVETDNQSGFALARPNLPLSN